MKIIRKISEVQGDRNVQDKKIAKKKAKAKAKIKCGPNMTPHKVDAPGNVIRYVCKRKDLAKAKKMKIARKKFLHTGAAKLSIQKAKDTKKFRESKEVEYIIWGIPPGKKHEEILYTKAKTEEEAKKVMKLLSSDKYKCTKLRLQVLDLSTELDFSKTVNFK